MNEITIEPFEALMASRGLVDMADVYEECVGLIADSVGNDVYAFEDQAAYRAWNELRNLLWEYFAETQDNLNDTSRALVLYINAVCKDDDEAAQELRDKIDGHDELRGEDEEEFGADVGGTSFEDIELNDPQDGIITDPGMTEADQPSGSSRSSDRYWYDSPSQENPGNAELDNNN